MPLLTCSRAPSSRSDLSLGYRHPTCPHRWMLIRFRWPKPLFELKCRHFDIRLFDLSPRNGNQEWKPRQMDQWTWKSTFDLSPKKKEPWKELSRTRSDVAASDLFPPLKLRCGCDRGLDQVTARFRNRPRARFAVILVILSSARSIATRGLAHYSGLRPPKNSSTVRIKAVVTLVAAKRITINSLMCAKLS
jgi:hypothetical protein